MKIWCTCLLKYFDLIKKVIAFKIKDNCLIKNDGYSLVIGSGNLGVGWGLPEPVSGKIPHPL